MGRKNLAETRTNEILEALARCLVKYGLDATLEQIAEEANMTRSIIRHYIGNREEVLNTLIERIAQDYIALLNEAASTIPQSQMIEATLDYLFDTPTNYDYNDKLIIDVMMTAKDRYPQAKQIIMALIQQLVDMFAHDLMQAYPNADKIQCHQVAYSIICLALSHESLVFAGISDMYQQAARLSSEALIKTLE
jgi:AcrR family transcriptional regulator